MATPTENTDARINFRLRGDQKQVIEQAAAQTGQSVTDFAVSTLLLRAREVMQEHTETRLSQRDRDLLLALLDDPNTEPNDALAAADQRYRRARG